MPSDRGSLRALKNMIAEVDLILETAPELPQNRTPRSRELLRAALALTNDLISEDSKSDKSHAAAMGRKGGAKIAERGPEYFRELSAKRRTKAGGRPRKRNSIPAG